MKIFKKPVLYILVLIASAIYVYYVSEKPVIYTIPAKTKGELIAIKGKNFGKVQKKSFLRIFYNGNVEKRMHYLDWSDTLIVLEAKRDFKIAEIQVVKRVFGLNFRSNKRLFLRKFFSGINYDVPVQQNSPWPLFRHDRKNTGYSSMAVSLNKKLKPWVVKTGKGIFSTPVIDQNETVYVGSADHLFYAIDKNGQVLWTFPCDEIIDSGAAVMDSEDSTETNVVLPSGDGFVYKLRTLNALLPEERVVWKFSARADKHFNSWFEGNIAVGFDGEIYAGNTNFNYYCLTDNGKLKWKYPTKSNNWSQAAIADDGTIFWGSNDTYVRAVSPAGKELWATRTWGMIAASAAIGSDGTVYIGSFDTYLYALDAFDGSVKWKFKTNGHVYASVALEPDSLGHTKRILFGSADGFFYALNTRGELLWKFCAGDVIRASAALGKNPENEQKNIVYFGCGNGNLYALNTEDGSLRWKYDFTPDDVVLKDRNDLNASVALGKNGIYTAGEHGLVCFMPYDYPIWGGEMIGDSLKNELPADTAYWQFISSGGNLIEDSCAVFSGFPVITLKLNVRKNNEVANAFLCKTPFICSNEDLQVDILPKVDFRFQKSADGRYLYVLPEQFLAAGTYTLKIKVNYYTGGWHWGNITLGGTKAGRIEAVKKFTVSEPEQSEVLNDTTSIFELSRIAVPLPTMLPSLNQIGFDYMDWAVSIVKKMPEDSLNIRAILWVQGISRTKQGQKVLDAQSDFFFPLKARFRGNQFVFEQKNMTLPITGIPIPFQSLLLSGEFKTRSWESKQADLFANTDVLDIPVFGKYLVMMGLANDVYKNLLVSGTFLTQKADSSLIKTAKQQNVVFVSYEFIPPKEQEGNLFVKKKKKNDSLFGRTNYQAAICLYNRTSLEPVFLNYRQMTQVLHSAGGKLNGVSLKIPSETQLPKNLGAIVLINSLKIKDIEIKND